MSPFHHFEGRASNSRTAATTVSVVISSIPSSGCERRACEVELAELRNTMLRVP